jgi:integrase
MPKRVPPLSAKTLAAVRPGSKPIELVDGYLPGLRVRVLPTGTLSWSLNIRDRKGVRRRFDLGANLSLSEARKKADGMRQAIRDGHDPTAERRAAHQRVKSAREGIGTLQALLETYFTTGPGGQQKRAADNKRLLLTVFAKALAQPTLDLDAPELQLIDDTWQSPSTASPAVRLVRPCLKWAERRKLVGPGTNALEQPAKVRQRDRVLSRNELRAIWPHLSGPHGEVLKWLLLTGCRLNEAAGMRWQEIAQNKWTIPGTRTKNGRPRTVPLAQQALALLAAIEARCAGQGFGASTDALRTQQPTTVGDLVFGAGGAKRLSNFDRYTKRVHKTSDTSGWHRHDLRRTVATLLGDLGFAPHVVIIVLGHAHTAAGATAIYARSRYEREHREALEALANNIDRITAGNDDNVIRLATAG